MTPEILMSIGEYIIQPICLAAIFIVAIRSISK